MQIGDTLYTRDENRRKYIEVNGRKEADKEYYWLGHTITGETRDSWILDNGRYKADKKTLALRGIRDFFGLDARVYTAEQKADRLWEDQNRHKVIRALEKATTDQLRQIAAILDSVRE